MSRWPLKPLGEICSTTSGGTPSRSHPEYFGGAIPWIKSGDLTDGDVIACDENITEEAIRSSSAKLFPKGTVLIAMYGATVGKLGMLGIEAATNQAVCGITPSDKLDRWFLFFFLLSQRKNLIGQSAGGAQPNISQKIVRELHVPVPPLPEQRRIVDLLSRAEGIVRLRREAEKKAAELIPALFLDMFGDPASNPKGWPVESLGRHVGIPSVVRTPDLATESDFLCMGADSIESMSGKLISMPTVRDVLPKSGKYWFDAGDVLYSKIRPYLAKATLAHTGGYCSADMYPLRCESTLRPMFLRSLLLSRAFTEYATAESVRASMPKLNRETLFKYQLPVPPADLQDTFSEQAEAMQSIQSQQSTATAKAQATFDALLAQAFHFTESIA